MSSLDNSNVRFFFRKYERLRKQKDIDKVLSLGEKIFVNGLIVYILEREAEAKHSRIAVLVSSKTEGLAVYRNKFKRRIREIFRLNKHKILKPLDIVVIATKQVVRAKYGKLQECFIKAIKKYCVSG